MPTGHDESSDQLETEVVERRDEVARARAFRNQSQAVAQPAEEKLDWARAQVARFEGPHVPRAAAREALGRGELVEARLHLSRIGGATEERADAARLDWIASALRAASGDPVAAVHAGFAAALAIGEPRGFLSADEWFRVYAQRIAHALVADPTRRFRGWLGAHFALASREFEAARRAATSVVDSAPPGQAWVEAARLAFALGPATSARAWLHAACIDSPIELSPEPPGLERCGVPALDEAPAPPPMPGPITELFDAVRDLEDLPTPRTGWVAVLGEIDRVLAPLDPSDVEVSATQPRDGAAVRTFIAALRAARRSRERDGARSSDRCSDRELRARRRMQRLSPALLERYLRRLGGPLL